MIDRRFVRTRRSVALLSLLALSACASSTADAAPEATATEPTTTGAQLPSEERAPAVALPGDGDPASASAPAPAPAPASPASDAPAPAPASPTPDTTPVPYRGINLAGAEFGDALPGKEGTDYSFPTTAEVDYYLSKGMTTFRIGFKWERMQRAARGAFDATYTAKLDAVIAYATSKGAKVILNPHNFARYYGNTVGSPQVPNDVFADFWSKLSAKWASDANVMFNLVNEPHDMPTEQWVDAANAAIAAIRATGATNVIVVPGNAWTGAHSWASSGYGTPNAVAMLKIVDPASNVVFEAHQYMDSDSSGSSGQCVSATIGSERLAPFITWLRAHELKGMIGELAGGRNAACNTAVTNMLSTIMESSDVLVGWQWWAGGPGWGEYEFTLHPTSGKDRPQMAVIAPFLKR